MKVYLVVEIADPDPYVSCGYIIQQIFAKREDAENFIAFSTYDECLEVLEWEVI